MANEEVLEKTSVEELLQELRSRAASKEVTATSAMASKSKDNNPLAEFDDATLGKALKSNQKVIYGTDNRVDIFQLAAGANLNDADSVVALFDKTDVKDNGDGTSTLQTQNFGVAKNLCKSERFRNQPTGAFCSGFLVAPDVIATAGHCANNSTVQNIRFVFGFRMKDVNVAITKIKSSEIYRGVSIIGRKEVGDGADWALVRIDRPVTNHRIARIRRSGKISNTQSVHVIGHPVGLPAKFADGATVRTNDAAPFFVANLDTYGGNSGSPVFNSTNHEVEGVLVRGETDFVKQGSCNVSLVCPTTGCRGEDVTRTTEFAKLVPVTSVWPNGKAYFFKAAQYDRYDPVADKVDAAYPKPIGGNWNGFPASFASGINAYAVWPNGKAYFFKGSEYVRFDIATDKVDPGYPKSITGNWQGLFTSSIDAAVVWPTGKAYFFKGSQYSRFDIAADKVDAGYPKPIAGNWNGFTANFSAGINAAVMWTNGKAYFFKGSEYVRFDVAADKVDAGYPKAIAANWPGLFTSNLDA